MGLFDVLLAANSSEGAPPSLQSLETKRNCKRLQSQRSKYETLTKDYAQEIEFASHLSGAGEFTISNSTTATSSSSLDGSTPQLDPLSIFALEAEAKERRFKRRHSNESMLEQLVDTSGSEESDDDEEVDEEQDIEEILATIIKDLKRLQPEHATFFIDYCKNKKDMHEEDAAEQRRVSLKELLYFFAREHPSLGYHQGMHELASLLLLVAELDLFSENSDKPKTSLFLNDQYLLHDTYTMMESLFLKIGPTYSGASDNLDVVSKLRFVSGDDKFLRYLVAMDVAPELYCARWVRLLFSREVTHWKVMLPLWDLFFDLTSQQPHVLSMGKGVSSYTRPRLTPALIPGRIDWVTVLETSAASLIWMQRKEYLTMDPEDGFCALVNLPPMDSVSRLMATILSTMRRIQHNQKPQRTGIEGIDATEGLITRGNSKNDSMRSLSSRSVCSNATNSFAFSWSGLSPRQSPKSTTSSRMPRRSVSPMPRNPSRSPTRSTSPGPISTRGQSPGPVSRMKSYNLPTGRSRSPFRPAATTASTADSSAITNTATPRRNYFRSMSNSNFIKNATAMLPSVPVLRSES